MLAEASDKVSERCGFTFDEKTGMYYDKSSRLYYDQARGMGRRKWWDSGRDGEEEMVGQREGWGGGNGGTVGGMGRRKWRDSGRDGEEEMAGQWEGWGGGNGGTMGGIGRDCSSFLLLDASHL